MPCQCGFRSFRQGHPRVGGSVGGVGGEGEDWRPQDQQEEIKKLNAQVELLNKQQGTGKRTRAVSCSLTRKRIARKSCSCFHGQLQILIFIFYCWCFATVVQEIQASPAFHWVGASEVLLPRSEDFPKLKTHLAPTHCQGAFGSNPTTYSRHHPTLATSSLPLLLRADHRSLWSPRVFMLGPPLLFGSFLICFSANSAPIS